MQLRPHRRTHRTAILASTPNGIRPCARGAGPPDGCVGISRSSRTDRAVGKIRRYEGNRPKQADVCQIGLTRPHVRDHRPSEPTEHIRPPCHKTLTTRERPGTFRGWTQPSPPCSKYRSRRVLAHMPCPCMRFIPAGVATTGKAPTYTRGDKTVLIIRVAPDRLDGSPAHKGVGSTEPSRIRLRQVSCVLREMRHAPPVGDA